MIMLHIRLYFIVLTVSFSTSALCQSSANYVPLESIAEMIEEADDLRRSGAYDSAENILLKMEDLILKSGRDTLLAQVYYHLGLVYDYDNKPQKALKYHREALTIREQSGLSQTLVARSYQAIGDVYIYVLRNGAEAEDSYLSALRIIKSFGLDSLEAHIYHSLAFANRIKGDFNLALDYIDSAMYTFNRLNINDIQFLANIHVVKANIYNSQMNFDSAIVYYHQGIRASKDIDQSTAIANYCINIGVCHNELKTYDSAIYYYHKARQISISLSDSVLLSNSYLGLGETYTASRPELRDSAQLYLSESLHIRRKIYGEIHSKTALAYRSLANYYWKFHQFDSAFLYIQKSLISFFDELESDKSIFVNPVVESLKNDRYANMVLVDKGKMLIDYYYLNPDKTNYLQTALETFIVASEAITINRKSFQEEGSKLFSLNHYNHILEGILECVYLLSRKELSSEHIKYAYQTMEVSKAVLLTESIAQASLESNVGLPDSLLQIENQLKSQMAYAKRMHDSIAIDSMARRQNWFKQILASRFSDYYQVNYRDEQSSIIELQKLIGKNEMIVEYFWGTNAVYALGVTKHEVNFISIEKDEDIVLQYVEDLTSPPDFEHLQEQFTSYCLHSHEVFQKFLSPILSKDSHITRLTIIPDGPLVYIPFESIIIEAPLYDAINYQQLNYLIRDFEISYAYSSKWLSQSRSSKTILSNPSVLTFAYAGKNELIGTGEESQFIQSSFMGKLFSGKHATKNNFLEGAKGFDIIHLAIHGQANVNDRERSMLIFNSDRGYDTLYANKIYDANLNNKITVLASCESGIGKLQRGEGVYSIARAFAYKGSKSIIMSQWKINDESTAELMKSFYKKLKNSSTSQALHQTKINYLENTDSLSAHPYNWAGLLAIGDIQIEGRNHHLFIIVCTVLLFIFTLLLLQKKVF